MQLRLLSAAVGLVLMVGLFPRGSEGAVYRDPCAYEGQAAHILDLVVYKKAQGFESYVIFGDREMRMVSTYGWFSTSINNRPIIRYQVLECKKFQFFTRGIQREEVLGFMFPWIPLDSIRDVVNWRVGGPADVYCIRFGATYTATKTVCEDFYARF